MRKEEILTYLSATTKMPKSKIEKVYREFMRLTIDALKKGEEISLRGFGKFYLVKTNERMYINPKTQKKYKSKSKCIIKFKMSETFKYYLA